MTNWNIYRPSKLGANLWCLLVKIKPSQILARDGIISIMMLHLSRFILLFSAFIFNNYREAPVLGAWGLTRFHAMKDRPDAIIKRKPEIKTSQFEIFLGRFRFFILELSREKNILFFKNEARKRNRNFIHVHVRSRMFVTGMQFEINQPLYWHNCVTRRVNTW